MTLALELLSAQPHGGGARLTLAGRAEVLDVVPGQVQVRAWGRVPGQPSVLDVQTLWGRQPVRVPAAQLAAVCEALGISPRFPCPTCEGEGVTDTPAPGVPPRCPACTGRGTVTRAQLARYEAQVLSEQSKRPPPCPRCDGEGQVWAVPYDTPRECPECEGRGVLDVYTPDGPPVCPVCDGTGTPDPDALGVYLAAQAERAASSTPLTPSTPGKVEP